jgi:hypothetical protein
MKTPAHIRFAARRVRAKAPHAKLLLGVWSASDDKALEDLRQAIGTDHFAKDFQQAAQWILSEAAAEPTTIADAPLAAAAVPG